jgi:hypothetical protein
LGFAFIFAAIAARLCCTAALANRNQEQHGRAEKNISGAVFHIGKIYCHILSISKHFRWQAKGQKAVSQNKKRPFD